MDLEQRKARMKAAGIPMPITQAPISEGATGAVPVTSKNADLHSRLQALKSGANKQAVQDIVNSKGRQQFQAIPEPKRTNAQPVASENKVPVQRSFGPQAKTSGEFAMMDALYGGDGGYAQPTMNLNPGAGTMDTTQPELSIQQDGYGPAYNPQQALAEKRRRTQDESGGYMQYAANPEGHAQAMQQAMNPNQQQFNFENMKKMMEQIAKSTISDVLSEYTQKQKGKLNFESYGKAKDGNQIVKTPEGKYFKMIPVKIKS
jgi:hypothetical protein